jgi:small GTP-binding protein
VLKAWKNFNFGIWDTAGQEKFARISSYYTRGAQGAILAYDITDLESFQLLSNYVEFLKGASKDCWIVVIGTKLDVAEEDAGMRQVSTEMGKAFAKQLSAPFYETR